MVTNISDLIKKAVDKNMLVFDRTNEIGYITPRLLHLMEECVSAKIRMLYFLTPKDIKFARDCKFDTYPCVLAYNEKVMYKHSLVLGIMNNGDVILGTY